MVKTTRVEYILPETETNSSPTEIWLLEDHFPFWDAIESRFCWNIFFQPKKVTELQTAWYGIPNVWPFFVLSWTSRCKTDARLVFLYQKVVVLCHTRTPKWIIVNRLPPPPNKSPRILFRIHLRGVIFISLNSRDFRDFFFTTDLPLETSNPNNYLWSHVCQCIQGIMTLTLITLTFRIGCFTGKRNRVATGYLIHFASQLLKSNLRMRGGLLLAVVNANWQVQVTTPTTSVCVSHIECFFWPLQEGASCFITLFSCMRWHKVKHWIANLVVLQDWVSLLFVFFRRRRLISCSEGSFWQAAILKPRSGIWKKSNQAFGYVACI